MGDLTVGRIETRVAGGNFRIPGELDEDGVESLRALAIVRTGSAWATAAAVYAWTEPSQGERTDLGENSPKLTITAFAGLGLRGLSSRKTVRRYRRAWEHAVQQGWAEPAEPGASVALPERDFEFAPEPERVTPDEPAVPPNARRQHLNNEATWTPATTEAVKGEQPAYGEAMGRTPAPWEGVAPDEPPKSKVEALREARERQAEAAEAAVKREEEEDSVPVSEGVSVEEVVRLGMELYDEDGLTRDQAADEIGMGAYSFSRARYVVMVADYEHLTDSERETAEEALRRMNETNQIEPSYRLIEEIVTRIWGEGKDRRKAPGEVAADRIAEFDRKVGMLTQTCAMAPGINVPRLSPERLETVLAELTTAARQVRQLRRSIKESHQ